MRGFFIILLVATCASAQVPERPSFQTLRYNEDWSLLRDHGGSNLGTFNPLFPKGAYFNEASFVGPQNLMDLQPGVEFAPTKSVKLTTSCDFVWQESLDDGVYGVAKNLQVPPGASQARYIGAFPTVTLSWQARRHLNFIVNYVAYRFGDFVTQSQPAQGNGSYVSAAAVFRF